MFRKGSSDTLEIWHAEDANEMYDYIKKHIVEFVPNAWVTSRPLTDLHVIRPELEDTPTVVFVIVSPEAVSFLEDHSAATFTVVKTPPNKCSYFLWLNDDADAQTFCAQYESRFTSFSSWTRLDFGENECSVSFDVLAGLLSPLGRKGASLPASEKPTKGPKKSKTAASSEAKKNCAFMVIPNKVMTVQGIGSTVSIVIDPRYNCMKPTAFLTKVGTPTKQKLELALTELSRPGVYTFDVPDGTIGSYHVHVNVNESGKTLGSRSFTVTTVTADFIYNLTNPLRVMCDALRVEDTDKLDELLSQSFVSYTPVDVDLQAAFSIDGGSGEECVSVNREVPTLLHFACKYNLRNLLSKLIDSPGALKTCVIKNRHGETPADVAVKAGNSEAAKMIENFQELACCLYDTYGSIDQTQEAPDYVVGEQRGLPYTNASGSTNSSQTHGQYIYSVSAKQPTYISMIGGKSSDDNNSDEYEYSVANIIDGHRTECNNDEGEEDYLTPSMISPQLCQRPFPQLPAKPEAVDRVHATGCATMPRTGYSKLPMTAADFVAKNDPVATVKGDLRTQFDEQSKQLLTSVKNGELTQAEAVRVFNDFSKRYNSIKGKSFTEKMQQFDELKKSGPPLGFKQKLLQKIVPGRWQSDSPAKPPSSPSFASSAAAGGGVLYSTPQRKLSLQNQGSSGLLHGSPVLSPRTPTKEFERGAGGEAYSGSSDEDGASSQEESPPPVPIRRVGTRPAVTPRMSAK